MTANQSEQIPSEIHLQFDQFGCAHVSEPPERGAIKYIRADLVEKMKDFG